MSSDILFRKYPSNPHVIDVFVMKTTPIHRSIALDDTNWLPNWYSSSAKHAVNKRIRSQVSEGIDRGGFRDDRGWCDGRTAAYAIPQLCGLIPHAEQLDLSREEIKRSISEALDFCLRRQAPDGRLDLHGTYSPNEAGFPLPAMAAAYRLLPGIAPDVFDLIAERLQEFMSKAAEAVLAGDAYSANHRWAAAAAPLAAVHRLFPDDRYLAKIDEYLADGIDCDKDGFWFEERSPNYNTVANHGMLILADEIGRPDLLDHVIKNCQLSLSFVQPNGEADTSYSHRQDRGKSGRPAGDYRVVRRAALASGDGRLTSLAQQLRHDRPNEALMPLPLEWLEHPGEMPPPEPISKRFEIHWPNRHLARWCDRATAMTLAADPGDHFFDTVLDQWGGDKRSEDWLHLHHGSVVIQSVRLELANVGSIRPSQLIRVGPRHYELSENCEGWDHIAHFRPGSPKVRMKHRRQASVSVMADSTGLRLQIHSTSPDHLYASLRVFVRAGAHADGIGKLRAGAHYNVTSSSLVLHHGTDAISITGLPSSELSAPPPAPTRIPTLLEGHCACLSLGLRMPVDLDLAISPRTRQRKSRGINAVVTK